MTLKEFWENKKNIAIHCDTEEKAKMVCKSFDYMCELVWQCKARCINTLWEREEENSCYWNNGGCSSTETCKANNVPIIEFDEMETFLIRELEDKQ